MKSPNAKSTASPRSPSYSTDLTPPVPFLWGGAHEQFAGEKKGKQWHPGDAPSQASQWAVQAVAKAGTIGIIGVYPENMRFFPIGKAMNRNISLHMGNCRHRKYIPELMEIVSCGAVKPERIITQE